MVGGEYLVIAFFFGLAGRRRRQAQGQLVLAVVPDLGDRRRSSGSSRRSSTASRATSCASSARAAGKIVKLYDALCTRCGTELDFPEVAQSSRRRVARAGPA